MPWKSSDLVPRVILDQQNSTISIMPSNWAFKAQMIKFSCLCYNCHAFKIRKTLDFFCLITGSPIFMCQFLHNSMYLLNATLLYFSVALILIFNQLHWHQEYSVLGLRFYFQIIVTILLLWSNCCCVSDLDGKNSCFFNPSYFDIAST